MSPSHIEGAVRDVLKGRFSCLPHIQFQNSSTFGLSIAFLKSTNELFRKAPVVKRCPSPCHIVEIGMAS